MKNTDQARSDENFGDQLRNLRDTTSMELREFCLAVGMRPSDYSRLERGIDPASQNHAELEPIRVALGLSRDSEPWNDLLRLADLSRVAAPRTMTDSEVMAKMPAFAGPLKDHQVSELMVMIRREHTPLI